MDYAEKMQRCNEYVEALEGERRKIQVFQRELPLCLELVTQAIEACRKELSGTTTDYMHGQSECSEQTSSDGPVLEEFIPIKRARSSSDVNGNDDDDDDNRDHEQRSRKRNRSSVGSHINNEKACSNSHNNNSDHKKKSDWLRSVQLWNQSPDPPPARPELPREAAVTEVKRDGVGGAFHPFRREKSNVKTSTNNQMAKKPASSPPASATSSMTEMVTAEANNGGGGNSKGEETDGQTQRKQRRCWSPELHRRFLQALQQLGGSHAATPKQIRELMKVDGLTNDEVKSHLQKYRLHTRRPSPSHGIHNTASTQAPQFVVVGGIWVPPPPEYAAVATRTTTSREAATIAASHGIYTPLAAPPPLKTQHASKSNSPAQKSPQTESDHLPSEGRSSHSEEGHHSNSSSTSSTTHTTTNSPEY